MQNFHYDINKLRNIPVNIDSWTYEQVGKGNDGPFKENYQNLEIKSLFSILFLEKGLHVSRETLR